MNRAVLGCCELESEDETVAVEHVEKVYNFYSGIYDSVFGRVFQSGREIAPALLDLSPGDRLLEVGIGTGLCLPLLPRTIEITGVDLSQKMLDKAHDRVKALGFKHVDLIKMDATRLQFPDATFDRVLAAYFISTVPDPVAVVKEMKRVCKPGGYLVFLNHFLSDNKFLAVLERLYSPLCYRIGFRTDLNLYRLMQDTGLAIETMEYIDFMGHWKAVRCVNPK